MRLFKPVTSYKYNLNGALYRLNIKLFNRLALL
jgi:hypothetical protein